METNLLFSDWVPHLWFPNVIQAVFYSEVLDKILKINVTNRARRLIDEAYGLDFYLLKTSDLDLNSKLGSDLRRLGTDFLAEVLHYRTALGTF